MRGRIRRRLALAIFLTAIIPVCAAIWLSRTMLRQSSERFFWPEIRQRLEQSLGLYQELAGAVKGRMRSDTEAIAASPDLRAALAARDRAALMGELSSAIERFPELASLAVRDESEELLGEADRGSPLDPERELSLRVNLPLPGGALLEAVFATPRARFEQLEDMGRFVDTYAQIEKRREDDETTYVYAFAAVLVITIALAVGVGSSLARGVSRRLGRLSEATTQVGAGDLSLRVEVSGNDEISELARAFNHMLEEVETNRDRIEYLQQLATWQGMARRLAHEIKNPLTPIQLAVQEIHQRYTGNDPAYRQLMNTTLEVVEAEVGTLHRLVTEFSDFARLPKAKLSRDDLLAFLRSERSQRELTEEHEASVKLQFELPKAETAPVDLDRQMFRRVLVNLINNAVQALAGSTGDPRVLIHAERAGNKSVRLYVDDNGPGIPEPLRPTIFDPYVTFAAGGTGLGLAIVKKIVVEHGGSIDVGESPLGGARIAITLPLAAHGAEPELAGAERVAAGQAQIDAA